MDEKVTKRIWGREATLLALLRRYEYGKFTISKSEGIIIRLEPVQSILIEQGEDILDDIE